MPEEDDVLHELDDDHRDGDGAQAISAYAKFQCAAVLTLLKFYLWNYGYICHFLFRPISNRCVEQMHGCVAQMHII